MSAVEIIRELTTFRGPACLVRKDGDYFVVSGPVNTSDRGPETLVFRSDENGEPADWVDVAGGAGMSRQEAIDDLAGAS
ncbi:MAG: hypothetical protein ACLP7J_09245 [Streptosporangiaceae bacterium]